MAAPVGMVGWSFYFRERSPWFLIVSIIGAFYVIILTRAAGNTTTRRKIVWESEWQSALRGGFNS